MYSRTINFIQDFTILYFLHQKVLSFGISNHQITFEDIGRVI